MHGRTRKALCSGRTRDDAGQLRLGADIVHDGGSREGAGGGVAVEGRAHQVRQAQPPQLLGCAARMHRVKESLLNALVEQGVRVPKGLFQENRQATQEWSTRCQHSRPLHCSGLSLWLVHPFLENDWLRKETIRFSPLLGIFAEGAKTASTPGQGSRRTEEENAAGW